MGFLDDAKNMMDEHDDQVDQGIEKAGDFADERTGGKYADKVDQAQEFLEGQTGDNDPQTQAMPDQAGQDAARNQGIDPADTQQNR